MARLSTDQWLGTLLGAGQADEFAPARSGGMSDEELLATLSQQQPPDPPPAIPAPPPTASPVGVQLAADGVSAPAAARSREEMLLSTLQRPSGRDLGMAAMFDSLVGGTRHSDDARARRNTFDQARIGAQAADLGSAERAGEAEQSRGMQREQMDITRRGQDFADKRAEEQRALQQYLLEQRLGAQDKLQDKRDANAYERAKLGRHHAGGPQTPEARAEAEDVRLSMEAAHLVRVANAPGKPAPYTQAQAKAYLKGEPTDLPPEAIAQLELERATLAGMRSQDPKKYADMIASASKGEAASAESIGKGIVSKVTDPIRIEGARKELLMMRAPINDANASWGQLGPKAKEILTQYGGSGENALVNALKTASLSPDEQVAAARIQRVVNEDIKRFAGSAVTGSEWARQAAAMGLPSGDFDPWKNPAVLKDYLRKVTDTYRALKANSEATYQDLWQGFEMPKSAGAK